MNTNAIIGDEYGIDIPETTVSEDKLIEEKKAARYSKSKEFKQLKEYMEERIRFYQKYLPDGREITSVNTQELAAKWEVANIIVREFNLIIDAYEQAAQVVKEAEAGN